MLAAVLATVLATALHFDVPRGSVGGDLRMSGITRLFREQIWNKKVQTLRRKIQLNSDGITNAFLCSCVALHNTNILKDYYSVRLVQIDFL